MIDMLKKLGLPATIAALVSTVVTVTPFIFKIDERYAKSDELTETIKKTDEKLSALSEEVNKLAGVTQVLIAISSNSPVRSAPPSPEPVAATAPRTSTSPSSAPLIIESVDVPEAPKPNATVAEKRATLEQAQEVLSASQRNIQQIKKY